MPAFRPVVRLLIAASALLGPLSALAETAPDAASASENRWFVLGGAYNYHARLEDSERRIDLLINGVLGKLFLRWREPRTFKDWSNDWMLWNGLGGIGRDINPKWDWSINFGGGAATIRNAHAYQPLGIPLGTRIYFTSTDFFAEGAIDYYPWGRPVWPQDRSERPGTGILSALRHAKPYLTASAGFYRQRSLADVRLNMPIVGNILKVTCRDAYDAIYVRPRISVEIPVARRDSVNLSIGYAFFTEHAEELDLVSMGIYLKHRF